MYNLLNYHNFFVNKLKKQKTNKIKIELNTKTITYISNNN